MRATEPGRSTTWELRIAPYEIMLILNANAEEERQEEMIERCQQMLRDGGGVIEHLNDWGRRKLTYPMEKVADGRYVVITCSAEPGSLDEMDRVLAINKDVVLRSMFHRLTSVEAEHASANGAPAPVDDRPEGETRPQRGPRAGGRRRR